MPGTVLMVTWDGAGNIPPEFALCGALVDAGHRVYVFSHDSLQDRAQRIGARFVPIRRAGQMNAVEAVPEGEGIEKLFENVFLPDGLLADLDDAIDGISPAVAIVDSMMLLPAALTRQPGIPTIGFHHTLAEFAFGGPFEMFSTMTKAPFDAAILNRGLSAYEKPIQALLDANTILTSTYREFDAHTAGIPDHVVHVGPLKAAPRPGSEAPDRHYPERPYVVVSLSTSYMDQKSLIQKIADALSGLAVEGLVTTGPAISAASLTLPENVSAVEFVPHETVLPNADLLITHAGHGTVAAGATAGVPMLCIPMGRDQPQVASRASDLGLAHVCSPDVVDAELANNIIMALGDTKMADDARRFSKEARAHPGMERAVQCVEALI
jgi:MGT family glycosyltransferase